jgi:hypothetical protein
VTDAAYVIPVVVLVYVFLKVNPAGTPIANGGVDAEDAAGNTVDAILDLLCRG